MSILGKLFTRRSGQVVPAKTVSEPHVECPHVTLTGRWDSVADMGKDDRATGFVCGSCHEQFGPEEGRRLLETTRERLHADEVERARQRAEAKRTTPPGS